MKSPIDEFDLKWWVNHRERALQHKWYAIGRMDLLVISLSGGGLYVIFEILKFIKAETLVADTSVLKICGISFASAIVMNFLSQVASYRAHKNEAKWARIKIDETRKIAIDKLKMQKLDMFIEVYNGIVSWTNMLSVLAMMVGISLLAIFAYVNL